MPAQKNSSTRSNFNESLNYRPDSGVHRGPVFFQTSVVFLLLFILAAVGWYGNQLLVILVPENSLPIQSFAVEKGGEWSYHYKHSVQQTPVDEFFRVNGVDDMTMTHTTYESLGVGLPYDPAEGTFKSLKKDGKFDLEMNRPYKSLMFRTAVQAMPKIIHKDKTYDLCLLYGQGTLVEVKVIKRYQYWALHFL